MKSVIFLFLVFTASFKIAVADFGGHDVFTSLAQLEVLWKNDLKIVKQMEEAIENQNVTETVKKLLKIYIERHKDLELDTEPNYDYLGHPINAYQFVSHVAHGWTTLKKTLNTTVKNYNTTEEYKFFVEREKEKLPDLYDVEGAAFGLVRLHSLYGYNLTRFVHEGIISTTLDNGKVVLSKPSIRKLTSYDLGMMAYEAGSNGLYNSAPDVYEEAIKMSDAETAQKVDLTYLNGYKPNTKRMRELFTTSKKVHDHFLDTRGMKSRTHRAHQKPFDQKLRKKKKFKKAFKLEETILTRDKAEEYYNKFVNGNAEKSQKFNFVSEVQKDSLCRGEQLRSDEELGKLYCTYGHGDSKWLKLAPIKMEFNSFDPYHVTLKGILFDHECDEITKFLGPHLDFPPGRMNHKAKKNDWTMKNCWPTENDHEGLKKLNTRIEHLSGLHADSSKGFSERFMCGNYGIGGHYVIHPDYHYPAPKDYLPGATGNRIATILTVLQAPEAGGATVWPNAGITVFPEKGSAVFWYNLRPSAIPDDFTRHSACPVLLGQKWIGNKWVGYNAQWNGTRQCGLTPTELFQGPYS